MRFRSPRSQTRSLQTLSATPIYSAVQTEVLPPQARFIISHFSVFRVISFPVRTFAEPSTETYYSDFYQINVINNTVAQWALLDPGATLTAVANSGLASLSKGSVSSVYQFGGEQDGVTLEDQFLRYTRGAWQTQRSNNSLPSARMGHSMCSFDSLIWIFGGWQSTAPFLSDELWSFNTTSTLWQFHSAGENGPAGRFWHSGVYVPTSNSILVFGGATTFPFDEGILGDMWIYDLAANQWTPIDSIQLPSPRAGHASVYSTNDDAVYIFGGIGASGELLSDFWRFDVGNSVWNEVAPEGKQPSVRTNAQLVALASKLFMFGGFSSNGALDDSWSYAITLDTCLECDPGYYTGIPANCAAKCPSGSCLEGFNCSACTAGTFTNVTASTACEPCPAGTIAENQASIECQPCAQGHTSNAVGTRCLLCPAGTFNPLLAGGCLDCAPGNYSEVGATWCTQCPSGTYSSAPRASECTACGIGYYQPALNASSSKQCLQCPAGYYCPSSVTVKPVPCDAGYYCAPQSGEQSKCPLLFYSDAQSASCSASKMLYVAVGVGVAALVLVFVVVALCRRKPKEEPPLIPKADGPEYTGL